MAKIAPVRPRSGRKSSTWCAPLVPSLNNSSFFAQKCRIGASKRLSIAGDDSRASQRWRTTSYLRPASAFDSLKSSAKSSQEARRSQLVSATPVLSNGSLRTRAGVPRRLADYYVVPRSGRLDRRLLRVAERRSLETASGCRCYGRLFRHFASSCARKPRAPAHPSRSTRMPGSTWAIAA